MRFTCSWVARKKSRADVWLAGGVVDSDVNEEAVVGQVAHTEVRPVLLDRFQRWLHLHGKARATTRPGKLKHVPHRFMPPNVGVPPHEARKKEGGKMRQRSGGDHISMRREGRENRGEGRDESERQTGKLCGTDHRGTHVHWFTVLRDEGCRR